MSTVDKNMLVSFVNRLENQIEIVKTAQDDLKQIFEEAKSAGYETKALKTLIKLREIENDPKKSNQFEEEQYWVEAYKTALGMEKGE